MECAAGLCVSPCLGPALFSRGTAGQSSSTTASFCALGSLRCQPVSPNDLDTERPPQAGQQERGASRWGWRCCPSLEGMSEGWGFSVLLGELQYVTQGTSSLTPRFLGAALPAFLSAWHLWAACLFKGVLLSCSTSFCRPFCHCLEGLGQCLCGLESLQSQCPHVHLPLAPWGPHELEWPAKGPAAQGVVVRRLFLGTRLQAHRGLPN